MIFLIVMYGCESWTVKKAERQRIDAFELWCWRKLLRVPWTARRSNQSILKISPGCSLEGMMLKMKLQYFDHLMRRVDLEKTLRLGGTGGKRRRKCWLKVQHSENEDRGIWSHHFMANRWGNSGNSVRLYCLGSKITADGDCSHEIKRCLLLGKKVMTNLDSILKTRDITLPTKVRLVKAMVFPVVMYGCESWTISKAEC